MKYASQPNPQQRSQPLVHPARPPINPFKMEATGHRAAKQARALFLSLLGVELLLATLYWADILFGSPVPVLHALVDLDGEGNLPAWFSSLQLALISLCLWFLVFRHRQSDRPSRGFLALLASVFLLWSADETAQMHERLTGWIGQRYVDWLPAFLSEHKVVVALLFLALLALARLLWSDVVAFWQAHRRASVIAIFGFCVVFIGGAILETIGYKFFLNGTTPLLYQTEVCFEEVFEMIGASMILYATSGLAFGKAEELEKAKTAMALQPGIFKNNPIS